MTDLKTLKDLKFELTEISHAGYLLHYDKVKQEAIRWAKRYEFTEDYVFCEFFNISKDDLDNCEECGKPWNSEYHINDVCVGEIQEDLK